MLDPSATLPFCCLVSSYFRLPFSGLLRSASAGFTGSTTGLPLAAECWGVRALATGLPFFLDSKTRKQTPSDSSYSSSSSDSARKRKKSKKKKKRRKHRKDDSSDLSSSDYSDDSGSSEEIHYRRRRRKNKKHQKKELIRLCATLTTKLLTTAFKSKIIRFELGEDPLQRRIYFLTFIDSLNIVFSRYRETYEVFKDYPKMEGGM